MNCVDCEKYISRIDREHGTYQCEKCFDEMIIRFKKNLGEAE